MRVNYRDGGRIKIPRKNKPLEVLTAWINEARERNLIESNAMCLSTIGIDGFPRSRMVLLKHINDTEIGFFTNLESDKAVEISRNNRVAITMFWPELERQVRILGETYLMSGEEVGEYHISRPRLSQVAAFTSIQSKELVSLEALKEEFMKTEIIFQNKEIPVPKNWGGYKISVDSIEYWSGRPSRLHERILLELTKGKWEQRRLYP